MKTAELSTDLAYVLRKGEHGSSFPVLVIETLLWVERDVWRMINGTNTKVRVVRRAEKGARVGRGTSTYDYKLTGLPVLRLNANQYDFRDGANPEDQIIDSPKDLLAEALKLHEALDLVDSDTPVFQDGKKYRRVSVDARYADGQVRSVTVEFELVRPQDIRQEWGAFIDDERARILQEAEWARQRAERQASSNEQAYGISSRVTALLGEPANGYDHNAERRDIHRKLNTSSTYEVSHELLVKLLALAEGSSTQ
jgi:hypothetical protein